MAMRVTNSALYRKYTTSVNDVHSKLNKAMNKISSGAAYEAAADNPLAYYSGKRLDNTYIDVLNKKELLGDIQNRLYQQELGVRDIQSLLSSGNSGDTVATKISYIQNETNNEIPTTVGTIRDDLIQKVNAMVNDLNTQYENFYIYGGNDLAITPFSLSFDSSSNEMVLTYNHTFSGNDESTVFEFELKEEDGAYSFKLKDADEQVAIGSTGTTKSKGDLVLDVMKEQGRVDIGYGSIHDKNTLVDTYTGGLNVLTGITSASARTDTYTLEDVEKALASSAVGLTGQAIISTNKYKTYLENDRPQTIDDTMIDKDTFLENLSGIASEIDVASHNLGMAYSDLGNRYNILETTYDRLEDQKISLEEQYEDIMGADPYESIIEMYSYQQSYTASLQVSSNIMRMSLFDFMD